MGKQRDSMSGQTENISAPRQSAPEAGGDQPSGMNDGALPAELPVLPVRNLVLFPGMLVPLSINRPSSLTLLDECLPQNKIIGVITQRDPEKEEAGADDLYRV